MKGAEAFPASRVRPSASRLRSQRLVTRRGGFAGFVVGVVVAVVAGEGCRESECLVQDAAPVGDCEDFIGIAVSPCNSCYALHGCSCEGDDCAELFSARDDCEEYVGDAYCQCK